MLLEKTLGSKAKIKILKSLSSGKEMQLSDIKRTTNLSLSTVHEALKDLTELRVLAVRKIGKTRLYKINKGSYFARAVTELITKEKEFYKKLLRNYILLVKSTNILSITIFGSFARGKEFPRDIDILVVCKGNKSKIKNRIAGAEGNLLEKYDIYISTIILEENEFKTKVRNNDRFIINVIAEGKTIFGKNLEVLAYGKRGQ